MPRTLRQHIEHADAMFDALGLKTLLPQKGEPAPVRIDQVSRQLIYCVSVRRVVDKFDSTGKAAIYLRASDQVVEDLWRSIPEDQKNRVEKDMRRMRKALRRGGIPVGR